MADYITLVFTWPIDVVMAAVKTAFAAIFAAILVEALDAEITLALEAVESTKARLEDAAAQLDHEDNPYKPFSHNYNELMQYFNKYKKEQQLLSNETVESLISDTSGKHVLDQLVDSETYTITAKTNHRDNTYGTVSGAGTYEQGDVGTLTPIPEDGYVFVGWYADSGFKTLISTKESLDFTATQDATIYAKFASAVTVKIKKPSGEECGYRVFVDNANSDMVGQSFNVAKGSTVTFALEIKDGYIANSPVVKVTIQKSFNGRPIDAIVTLTPDPESGKYSFTANYDATVSISGVERDQTATPIITCTEDANGRLTIAATGEGVITL